MLEEAAGHLAVIGDGAALKWILDEQRIAFSERWRATALRLRAGSPLLLYVTTRCVQPTGRSAGIISRATLKNDAQRLAEPVRFGERQFTIGCSLNMPMLVPLDHVVALGPYIPQLHAFHGAWHLRLRATLVPLDAHDLSILEGAVRDVAETHGRARATYEAVASRKS